MSPDRSKSADEIFCRSCGERIKREAELCPHCGVRNKKGYKSSSNKNSSLSESKTHDPSDYTTTVGENWYYLVIIPTIFTIPGFILIFTADNFPILIFIGMVLVLGAVFLPIIGIHFDRQYVRANAEWHPSKLWMVVLFLLYPLNILIALFYLYRRQEVLDEPEFNWNIKS